MKKIFIILCLTLTLLAGITYAENSFTVQNITIDGHQRMVLIYLDEHGDTHFDYYTEPGNGETSKLLGVRIYKGGVLILDTYKNN